ncbi:MAG TPA: ATP-dependent DNA ligase [Ktedonobacterales bacterium]
MSSQSTPREGHLQFAELAQAFRQIERASGRREVTRILADLFLRAPQDARILPYLLQGRLGPPFATPDLGIDERGITQAIADATGRPVDEVWSEYQRQGDLGTVAEQLLASHGARADTSTMTSGGRTLSVQQVYDQLVGIAAASGTGGRSRKVARLRALLLQLDGLEARYVVRIIQGKLRLQIGDATIMDALSVAAAGSTTLRARIARAYSLSADLGLVAATLLSHGADALDQMHPTPGYPVLSELAERLPSPQAIIERLGSALIEPKYDGLRLQAQKDEDRIWLFTRRLEDVTASFPEIAQAVRSQVRAQRIILDGEAIGYDVQTGRFLSFQETSRRRRTHSVEQMAGSIPLRYFVFDVLLADGVDSTPWPQYERSQLLHRVLATDHEQPDDTEQPVLHITPQRETSDPAELERFFLAMLGEGLEGVMAKRPDAPYHAGGRSFDWVKLKPEYRIGLVDTFDLVVVGYDRGRGKRAALGIGSLLSAVYDPDQDRFRTVTRVGSGLSDAEWRRLRVQLDAARLPERPHQVEATITPDVWVEPRVVLEVLAGGITRSPQHTAGKSGREPGYALRFPRVVRIRDDRRPEDATTEKELLELARLTKRARRDTS